MPWKLQRSQVIIAVLPMLVLAVGVTLAWRQQQPAAAQAVATSPAETPFRRVSLAPMVAAAPVTQNLREAAAEPTEEPSYRTPLPNTPAAVMDKVRSALMATAPSGVTEASPEVISRAGGASPSDVILSGADGVLQVHVAQMDPGVTVPLGVMTSGSPLDSYLQLPDGTELVLASGGRESWQQVILFRGDLMVNIMGTRGEVGIRTGSPLTQDQMLAWAKRLAPLLP